ncbi:MAG: hypothetical protein RLY47_239 [Candidatus Parcubacteria bacterium]|jgi:hypothetical protein
MPQNETPNNPSAGATSPTDQPSAETENLVREGIRGIRDIFKKNGEDVEKETEMAIVRNDPPPPSPSLPFFALYCSICKDLIDFTLLELTGVGYVVVLILGWILWVILFFWFLGKMNGTWWRGFLIKRFWLWMVGVLVLESIPILKLVPANTILVLMAHYREKKMVKLIMLAMDLWHKYETPLREGGELPPLTGATPHIKGSKSPSGARGATPETPNRPTLITPEKNPVTASQEEHFADPSVPVTKGATPAKPAPKRTPPASRRQPNPQDEEVVTGLRPSQEDTSFTPDPYQEDPYALESATPRGIDSLPRQASRTEEQRIPFPGAGSSSFGRGTRQGGKPVDFDVRQKEASPEAVVDTTPSGATPIPRDVNDDVS